VTGSILVQVAANLSSEPKAKMTQAEVAAGSHVTFSGTATCDGCDEDLVLRVMPFVTPADDSKKAPPAPLTTKSVGKAGSFTVSVPQGDDAVILELLADDNGDAKPTAGERFAVLEMGGQLVPSKDKSGLDLDASDKDISNPPPATIPSEGDSQGGAPPAPQEGGGEEGGNTPPPGNGPQNPPDGPLPDPSGNNSGTPPDGGNPGDGSNIGPSGPPPEGGGQPG
jgi:hypothetical protein